MISWPFREHLPYHHGSVIQKLVLVLLVAVGFGTAVPAAGVSLPVVPNGVEVGGVDIGGLISVQAEAELARHVGQPIRIFHRTRVWRVSPRRLGASAAIADAMERALRARPGSSVPLEIRVNRSAVRRYVKRLNRQFAQPAKDAELIGLSEILTPSFTEARTGRRVDQAEMVRRLIRAIRSTYRGMQLQLAVEPVPPTVTPADFGSIVVIRRGSNRLYLYDGSALVRTFVVATGQAEYPTPLGEFEIVVKEENPTWTPPDSDWAQGLLPVPPGPGNPLGTRWMGLSAYAVGIHGTPDPASLGYSASHGCIRMAISEAEWLFERVDVGTPVYIVEA
jgi:lipoprotein-anchoring transpeptidase ErfK/SrfK